MSDEKYRAILERDPTDTQAFVALCDSAERNNDYQYLVQLYDFRAQVIADTQEIADLHFRAGEIYLDKLQDVAGGVEVLLKGFDADRAHAGIGDRLDAVYREAGDWESAVQIAEQRLEALTEADGNGTKTVIRSDLHQQAGEIWEKVYADKNKALIHYKKAIELDKTNLLALYGAREIYYEAGKFKNAAKLCELEARCEKDPDRRAALYRELAHIFSKKLLDQDQAVIALKRSLKFAPKNKDIKMDLSQAIAATELTESNEKDHKWAVEYLLRNASSADENELLELASKAVMALPMDTRGMDLIESRVSDPAQIAATYEEVIRKIRNPELQEPVIHRLAVLYQERLNDPHTAAAWLGKIGYQETPAAAPALDAAPADFGEAYPQESMAAAAPEPAPPAMAGFPMLDLPMQAPAGFPSQRPAPAIGVPVREAGMSDAEFVDVLRKAADRSRRSGDDVTAEECLIEVLDLEPHDQKATTYLERRFRARSDWLSLRDLLLRSSGASHLPQAVQTVRLREAARLSEEQLQDVTGAIEAWQTIKTNDPKVRDATDALIRLYDHAQRWEELLALLKQEIEITKSRTKKVDALRKLSNIYYLRLQDLTAAAKAFKAVLKLAPDDKEAIEALDDIYLKNGNYEELVTLLRERAELAQRREDKRDCLFKAARVLRDNLEQPEEAYGLAKEVMTLVRDDQEVVEFLISIDEAEEQWQRLIGLLEIRARFAQTDEEKLALLHRRASIAQEKVGDTRAAIKALNELLTVSPNDVEAMTMLAGIYRDKSDWDALVDIIKTQIGVTTDQIELANLHREVARVLENELDREEEAMASWHAVLEIEADAESLGALARFYERNGKWTEYVKVLEQQASVAETPEERAGILFNRAAIIDRELDDRERAKEELQRILNEVDATHDGSLNLLIDILVERGEFEEATDLLDQRISYTKDKDLAKTMLIQLGIWSKDELGDFDRAMESFEKAVGLDKGDDEALNLLDEVYVSLKEWEKLLKLVYARAKRKTDDSEKLDLLVRGAQICEKELGDKKKAWTWYVEMLDNLNHLPETIEIVEESARRMKLWKELIDLAGAMTRSAQLESDQVAWWLKAADVLETKMNDSGQALEAVLRAFGLEPDNEELLDRVDHLAVVVGNWQRLSTVYGVLVNRTAEKEEKVRLLTRYAKVLKDNANRLSDAFDISVKAFELDPNSDELLGMVEEMGSAAERWDDLIRIYGACANLAEDLDKKVDLKMREAAVFRDRKSDTDGALVSYIKAIRFDPFDEATREKVWAEIRALESDLVETESGTYWHKVIETYHILADQHKKNLEQQVELLLKVSEIHVSELGDITAAFESMKKVQELNPKDESSIDRLEVLAERNNYWEGLVDHLQDILDETFEMEVAIMLHRRRARILEERLDRGDEAAEHYWQIIQLDSQDTNAYAKLMAFYERTEKWNELVNMLERQLDNTEEDESKKDILFRIAGIWEKEIGNRYEARDWYEQILTLWPDEERAEASLALLLDGKVEADTSEEDDDMDALISLPPPEEDDLDDDEAAESPEALAPEAEAEPSEDSTWGEADAGVEDTEDAFGDTGIGEDVFESSEAVFEDTGEDGVEAGEAGGDTEDESEDESEDEFEDEFEDESEDESEDEFEDESEDEFEDESEDEFEDTPIGGEDDVVEAVSLDDEEGVGEERLVADESSYSDMDAPEDETQEREDDVFEDGISLDRGALEADAETETSEASEALGDAFDALLDDDAVLDAGDDVVARSLDSEDVPSSDDVQDEDLDGIEIDNEFILEADDLLVDDNVVLEDDEGSEKETAE